MKPYMICDADGHQLTDGVGENEVAAMAQRMANERGEPVYYSCGDEEATEVEPE